MKVSKCKNCIFCERKTCVTYAFHYCEKYERRCLDMKEKDCLAFCERSEDLSEVIRSNILECAKKMYEIQEKLKEGESE